MTRRRLIYCITALALLLAGCGNGGGAAGEPLRIVATTNVLGDLAFAMAGPDATVEVLMPIGVDPHDYQASSQQVARLTEADLVLAVGLGLEEGLENVLTTAAADGVNVVTLADRLDPLPFALGEGGLDPHVWLDPLRMARAARLIGAELEAIDPGPDWEGRAEDYAQALEALDADIVEILATVPEGRRKLVTNHDSLGYFADRYGFEVVGAVIPGGSTLAEPSSAELADLVATIEREGVPAIFAETSEPAALAEAVAAELEGEVAVIQLFVGSLGPEGSGAESLSDMLVTNAVLVAGALV